MNVLWGVIVTALSLLAWGGQVLSWRAPTTAEKWGLIEGEATTDPVFLADAGAEAQWDSFTLWVMVVAGVLLVGQVGAWTYFGLVGGGMYLYFAGRGIRTRFAMRRRGIAIGSDSNVRVGLTFSAIWGVMAVATIVAAVTSLES